MIRFILKFGVVLVLSAASGCVSTNDRVLDSKQNQIALRSIQTRAFDTSDKARAIRAVMATLQDLGFVLDKADESLGVVSGTKLNDYELRMTIIVRPQGDQRVVVRANGQFNQDPILEPLPYQRFFASLEKALFLQAQQVD